jgi:hypothetical protein
MTAEQYARLAEYVQEMKDCQELCGEWTAQEWQDYNDAWIDCDNNFNGYVKNGGVRPTRPHA